MSDNHDHGFAHPAPIKLLVAVFLALVALTVLTVVANDWPLGSFDIVVALCIATLKASLVALFFMHMYWDKGFNKFAFIGSFLFVALFIGLTLIDSDHYKEQQENFPVSNRPMEPQ